ncbi:MAG: MotA/TolQ/ExbB proton channel family protein [Hyphomicrobiaceae bacterium]|nr:MotA/TolQ/ExbB proton channel family protein [Hyphomicrobiaceae bacterium]MCC0011342.1 MotA/TolQ/ExbB proton channel family protein [Hyphomicrobiaceae bacterium]
MSLTSLILNADPVVQGVIALLVLASVICWALIFEKMVRLMALKREVRRLEATAQGAEVSNAQGRYANAILAAGEFEQQVGFDASEGTNDMRLRIERAMRGAVRGELKRIEAGLPFLATVGSAAPFIGLFGTVWGIMHSFTAIAQAKDTSLAVVAPGIAEALFATAIGLAAAIPAVVAYNQISVSLGRAAERTNAAVHRIAPRFANGARA